MNDLNGGLNFTSQLDNSKLVTDAAKAKATLKGIGDTAVVQGSAMERAFSSAYGLIGAGAVASIGILGKQILDVTAKFEKFGIVLRNTLGDARGTEALAMIANFAATTPFQLDEVTSAFIKMANQGFVPTREEMVKLGDLASSTGKNFDMLAEAILDAQTGEMERLKEFGIKASVAGDKVTFSFKEQKTTVENTASSIRGYILSLGELNGVAGANEKISASLTGQISNLGDKIAAMYNKIGTENKGLLYSAVGTASTLVENYEAVGDVVGGLIAVFGAYKLAVMYVAYEQKILAATNALIVESNGFLVASEARAIVMKERSLLAQERLNASMLANPYVLAAMAFTALGYAMYKLATQQTELEKATQKYNLEIAKEETGAARLFAELNHAEKGTTAWKNAKDAILSQYGTYLTEQQKELLGTKNQAEAQKAVNDGLRENIALKTRKESLDKIEETYGAQLEGYKSDLNDQITKKLGIQRAADVSQEIAPLIQNVKIAITDDEKAKATKDLKDFSEKLRKELYGGSFIFNDNLIGIDYALRQYTTNADAINKAFNTNLKASSGQVDTQSPDLKNYSEQREELQKQLSIEQKKLDEMKLANFDKLAEAKRNEIKSLEELLKTTNSEALKSDLERARTELKEITKQGENPFKAVEDQEKVVEGIKKQLGIKEKAAKQEKEDTKTTIELSKEYLAIQKQIIDKTKELQEANKKKDTDKGIQLTKDIDGLQKQLTTLTNGGEKIDPLGATVATKLLDKQLRPMKVITEEQRKQLELKAKKASWDYIIADEADELKDKIKEQSEYFYQAADAAQYLSRQIGDGNQGLADMVNGIANVAGQFGDLAAKGAFKKDATGKSMMSEADAIGAAISGATQLIGMMVGQAAENKRIMREYYASIIQQQQDYNLLLNEQLRLNSDINGTLFLRDYEGSLNDSTKAYNDAQKKYQEEYRKFLSSEAIVGKKNVVNGGNVLTGIGAGAAMGAGIGSIVPGIGTAIGAAVGGIVGALGGLFAKKKKDVVAPLLDTYPDLIKANGEFNASLAKTLIDNNKVTESTKQTLQNMIEWKDAADAATAQMKQVISDLAGSLGDDLRNVLVDAFVKGTDAAEAFGDSVEKVLEDIISNMLFNKAFEGLFKKLEDEMAASYGTGGDGSWLDDFGRFFKDAPDATKKFMQDMKDAQTAAGLEGFDIFGNKDAAAARTGSAKGIATASQDSVDENNGRLTAIQGHTFRMADTLDILKANSSSILNNVIEIKGHTESMQGGIQRMEGTLNSVKQGIETINLKGVKLQ